jgi:hypothetical protein
MLILTFLAGIIIYLTLKEDLLNFFKIPEKHIIIPTIFIIIFFIGLIGAITFYNMETINRNNNDQTNYTLYFCLTQSQNECQALANEATNNSYSRFLDGKIAKLEVSIPQSIPYQAQRNVGSPFFLGLIVGWALGVILNGKK